MLQKHTHFSVSNHSYCSLSRPNSTGRTIAQIVREVIFTFTVDTREGRTNAIDLSSMFWESTWDLLD